MVTTEAVGTVELRVYRSTRERPRVVIGGGVDLPVTLWVGTGVPDTLRAAGSVDVLALERGPWRLVGSAETRIGVQHALVGTTVPWDLALGGSCGLGGPSGFVGLGAAWEQPLATAVWFSDFVDGAFAGSSTPAPRDGVVPLGTGRATLGPEGVITIASRVALTAGAELVWTPDRFDLSWQEELVLGVWPFRVEVGAVVRL